MNWFVYILSCRDGSLYTGITTDCVRRLAQHNAGNGAKYTRAKLPVQLVYQERAENRSQATKREMAIKKLTRQQKQRLVAGH